jgi:hypothetical protein
MGICKSELAMERKLARENSTPGSRNGRRHTIGPAKFGRSRWMEGAFAEEDVGADSYFGVYNGDVITNHVSRKHYQLGPGVDPRYVLHVPLGRGTLVLP